MRIFTAEWALPVSSPPIKNGAVVFEAGTIVAAGTADEMKAKFPSAMVEDFGAAAIIPGLVNCHSHLELTIMRGMLDAVENDFPAWLMTLNKTRGESLSEDDIELSTLFGALEGARAGITCFGDVGRNGRASFKALNTIGLRGVVYQETEFSPDDSLASASFEKLKEKFLSLREKQTDLIEIGLSPHAPYTVCAELFKLIANYSLAENIKTTIHAAESGMEDDFMLRGEGFMADLRKKFGLAWNAPGVGTIEYLNSLGVLESKPLLVHCVNVDAHDLTLIAESRSPVAHCPKSNTKFGHGIAPLERMLAQNITVGLGSDSVASNNTCDLIEEARVAALMARTGREKSHLISAEKIFELMTLGGARALGLDDRIGTLEAGKQADLAVISFEHSAQMPVYEPHSAIVFASGARDVILTMVAGREIYRAGIVTNVNEARIKQQVNALRDRLSN